MVLLPALPVSAQGDGPIIVTRTTKLEFMSLENIRYAVELFFQSQVDENDPAGGPGVRDTETLYRETFEISGNGFFGHPNLVDFNFKGRLQLSQEDFDLESENVTRTSDEFLDEFDFSALFLKKSEAPFTLYARRSQALIDQQFGGSLDSVTTEFGVRLNLALKGMKNRLEYFHRTQDQTSRFGRNDFFLTQDTFQARGDFRPDDAHQLIWDYTFDSIKESGDFRPTNNFDRHDAFLVHNYHFGPENRSNLRSSFQLRSETGASPVDRLRVDERLFLWSDKNFDTTLNYVFDHQSRAGTKQTLNRGSAKFRHQLFESLTTNFEIGASHLELDADDFTSEQFHGRISFDYLKKIPLGTLDATVNVSHNRQDDSERGGTINILDESRTFDVADRITLNRRNIILTSIFITDLTGFIIYAVGVDYNVTFFGDRVDISRRLGGSIGAGQTVLIDYQVGPEPGGRITTDSLGVAVRYNIQEGAFRGVSLYMRLLDLDEDRPVGLGPNLPEADLRELVYGVEYNIDQLRLLGEMQRHDSTLSPFDKTRLEATYTHRFDNRGQLALSAAYSKVEGRDDDFDFSISTLSVNWDQPLTERLRASFYALWRDERDSNGIDSQGFEQRLELNWRYRQTSVFASFRNISTDSDLNDTSFQTLIVGFRREF